MTTCLMPTKTTQIHGSEQGFNQSRAAVSLVALGGVITSVVASLFTAMAPMSAEAKPAATPAALPLLEVNLKDVVKPTWGFQGALQGAGTPNAIGIGAFLPLVYGPNSIMLLDVQANYNFADSAGNSSLTAAELFGGTIATSSRLGYRWLNTNRSWLYGVNIGYDSRPLSIAAPSGAYGNGSGFFQQLAIGAEATNRDFRFNATARAPVGTTRQTLTNSYEATTLGTVNLDATYAIAQGLDATVGYYYQWGDLAEASGSGVQGKLAYAINNGLTAGVTVSYDNAFETRVMGDITYRFNTPKPRVASSGNVDLIAALSKPLPNRDVRVLTQATTAAAAAALLVCNKLVGLPYAPLAAWDLTGFTLGNTGSYSDGNFFIEPVTGTTLYRCVG